MFVCVSFAQCCSLYSFSWQCTAHSEEAVCRYINIKTSVAAWPYLISTFWLFNFTCLFCGEFNLSFRCFFFFLFLFLLRFKLHCLVIKERKALCLISTRHQYFYPWTTRFNLSLLLPPDFVFHFILFSFFPITWCCFPASVFCYLGPKNKLSSHSSSSQLQVTCPVCLCVLYCYCMGVVRWGLSVSSLLHSSFNLFLVSKFFCFVFLVVPRSLCFLLML